ncbi:tape measure protein [Bacteroides sp. BFG-257]|nr:tape measure protein [Bacteroides sp. BFG-257]UVO97735.1 tape measure protein [Bacteroides sp. BFG-257]
MSKLYFKVSSDWEEVVKLRNEIVKLKQELKSMDSTQSPATFKTLNTQLAASTQQLDGLVAKAAQAGAVMEGDFKKKIFDASQSVNGFTEKIIAQKNAVGSLQTTIRKNKELYKNIVSRGGEDKALLNHIREQERALGKERDALFNLTQQQAEARLSVKKIRDEYALYKDDAKDVTEANNGVAVSWKKALAVIGGAGVLKALGSEMIRVRGEFQAADTAIQTLLGSKEKADALMAQVREYAKISPLEFSDVTSATQMMLGFNIEAERVPRYLQAIGDVSMGNTQKFNSLTLAFSQMSAAGKLMGQDLNQMINAGFNPFQIMSEKTGKSIATLKDEMSKGAISAEMVQQAFIDATSAGGRFYNMSENASKEINGQLSMMQDALDSVFNELGQKSEGVIMDGIQMTTSLIENYETVGKVLAGLVVTYGTYRTAVMLVTAAENGHSAATLIMRGRILLAQKAQALLNATMLKNPYVLLATVAIGAASAVWAFSKRTTEAQEVQERYNASKEDAIRKEESHRQEIQRLISVAGDEAEATANRNAAIESLKKAYPGIIEKYIDEEGHLTNLIQLQKDLNEEQSKRKKESNQEKLASINAKVRNQEEYVSGMSGSKEAINEANDVLKELQRQQKEAQAAVNTDYINARIEEAKKFSDDELKKAISQWKSSLSRVTEDMIGEFSRDEVSSFVKSLETLQSAREKQSKNKKYWETKKKEAETALNSIASSQKKLMDAGKFKGIDETVIKSYKDNVKKLKEAEKELKVYDSSSKQESAAEKLRKQTDKYNVLLEKQALEQKRNAEDLQMRVDEARIKAMDEGSAKTIAEMELNFEKEMQAIDRQKEDTLRKKIEDARATWETSPDKKKGRDF